MMSLARDLARAPSPFPHYKSTHTSKYVYGAELGFRFRVAASGAEGGGSDPGRPQTVVSGNPDTRHTTLSTRVSNRNLVPADVPGDAGVPVPWETSRAAASTTPRRAASSSGAQSTETCGSGSS